MNIDEIFKNVIAIDKQIFTVYQKIIINEYQEKCNEKNIEQLKQLVELEKWAYSKIDLTIDKLGLIMEKLKENIETVLSGEILFSKVKSANILNNCLDERYIKQLIYCRILNYLDKLYYLNEMTPKNIDCINEGYYITEKIDDIVDIYVTDVSYFSLRMLNEEQYVEEALNNHDVVLTYNKEVKKELEIEAETDIEQLEIMLLELKSLVDEANKFFYIDEIYNNLFKNTVLEDRVIKADFSFDNLFAQLSIHKFFNNNNRKFLTIHREQLARLDIIDYLHNLFDYNDVDFTNDEEGRYNLITFKISLEQLKVKIGMMNHDDLSTIRNIFYAQYYNAINNNVCAKVVYNCLDDECRKLVQELFNFDVEKGKEKEYIN